MQKVWTAMGCEAMTDSSEDRVKSAKENWQLAQEWEKCGDHAKAREARDRAIEDEKCRDSWLYRTFGW